MVAPLSPTPPVSRWEEDDQAAVDLAGLTHRLPHEEADINNTVQANLPKNDGYPWSSKDQIVDSLLATKPKLN
jgi:hypothetical protein